MDPVKQFNEGAASYGIGVAVLLAMVAFLCLILWKFGNRIISAHEAYLIASREEQTKQTSELEKANVQLAEIKTTLPTVCGAQCPIDGRARVKPRPT
jgi:hypothetical protein